MYLHQVLQIDLPHNCMYFRISLGAGVYSPNVQWGGDFDTVPAEFWQRQ